MYVQLYVRTCSVFGFMCIFYCCRGSLTLARDYDIPQSNNKLKNFEHTLQIESSKLSIRMSLFVETCGTLMFNN